MFIWTKYHIQLALYWNANLREANLCRANLYGATLREADLCRANLYGATLYGADLREANLYEANLCGADLREANLYGANLCGANLCGADLREANLYGATLYGANLCGADLREANLYGATLYGADLHGIKTNHSIVPLKGSFIAFKKLRNDIIATLEIPKKAKRVGGLIGRKCRADYVKVISLSKGKIAYGFYDAKTKYVVGKITRANKWNGFPGVECTYGIHFFITRKEAEEFVL